MAIGRPREFEESEVLEQALALFWQQGYEATSVRDLTTRLGISNSTLYSAFGDKHALYLQVLAHYRERELAELEQALQGDRPVLETLQSFFGRLAAPAPGVVEQRGSFALAAAVELGLTDEAVAEQLRDHFDDVTRIFAMFLDRAMARGEVADTFAPGDLARYLLHNLYSIGTLATYFPEYVQSARMSAVVLSVLIPTKPVSSP